MNLANQSFRRTMAFMRRPALVSALVAVLVLGACSTSSDPSAADPAVDVPVSSAPAPASSSAPEAPSTTSSVPTYEEEFAAAFDRFASGGIYASDLRFILLQDRDWDRLEDERIKARVAGPVIFSSGEPVSYEVLESNRAGLDYRVGWSNFWSANDSGLQIVEEAHVLGSVAAAEKFASRWIAAFTAAGVTPLSSPAFVSAYPAGSLGPVSFSAFFNSGDEELPCESVNIGTRNNVVYHVRTSSAVCVRADALIGAWMVSGAIERSLRADQALAGG